jgi:hypothetical protein
VKSGQVNEMRTFGEITIEFVNKRTSPGHIVSSISYNIGRMDDFVSRCRHLLCPCFCNSPRFEPAKEERSM